MKICQQQKKLTPDNECQVSFQLEDSPFEKNKLVYNLSLDSQDLVSESLDAALIALLIPCMAANENITLDGPLSKRLYTYLPTIQKLLMSAYTELHMINVFCENLVCNSSSIENRSMATGFSGGVDSFAAVAELGKSNIDFFLFNNVGSHGKSGEKLFEKRYKKVNPCAEELSIPLLKINSNLDCFYDEKLLQFIYNHTLRNVSVALLLQEGINEFYYSSAYHLRDFQFVGRPTIAHFDPILLPMLSSERISILPHGTTQTRVDKTNIIVAEELSYKYLDVCVDEESASNCSNCVKCRRTMATLDILGKIHLYKESFNIDFYFNNKFHIFYELCVDKGALSREIIELAEEREFVVPFLARVLSKIKLPFRIRRRLVKKG